MNTDNRPENANYDTLIEYKRAIEQYIYWLTQEQTKMEMELKSVIQTFKEAA